MIKIRYVFQNDSALNCNIPIIYIKAFQYENVTRCCEEWNQITNLKHRRGFELSVGYYDQLRMNKTYGKGKIIFQHNE